MSKMKKNRGMTYVELVVVLSIFGVMLSISLFNHSKFREKVTIKNLANDVALKLVEAQKSAISGKLNALAGANWRPSYGVLFNIANPTKFLFFADLDNSGACSGSGCSNFTVGGEVLDVVNMTAGNSIPQPGGLARVGTGCPPVVTDIFVLFTRPSPTPSIVSVPPDGAGCTVSYYSVTVTSPQGSTAIIKIYPSGRIQIN